MKQTWTAANRERARRRALAHPEWNAKSKLAYAEKYPERVAAYEVAMRDPQPCDSCGGEGRPLYQIEPYVCIGWRCYPCRKKANA